MTGKEITKQKLKSMVHNRLLLIGEQIRSKRINSGLTITDVAKMCNINRHQISSVEEARTNYAIETLTLIVECLGIDVLHLKPKM